MNRTILVTCIFLTLAVINVAPAVSMPVGIHVHNPAHVQAAASAGYSAIRLWDTGTDWASLKPQQYLWRFDQIGAFLTASEKAHLKVLWTIGNTPRWASARPNESCSYGFGCAAEPVDVEHWRRYVRTIANTFRGRVECYEPWNEVSFPTDPAFRKPRTGGDPGQFFTGSIDAMVDLARIAFEEVKRADPKACVLSPSFHNSGNWAEKLDKYLAAGGGQYFDVVSQHFYFTEEPEESVPTIRAMRDILAKHGLGHLPMWNTEVGVPFSEKPNQWLGMTPEDQVYALSLRTYLVNLSQGIDRVYWYAWDNGKFGFFQSSDNAEVKRDAASAAVHFFSGLTSANCEHKNYMWQCHVHAGARKFKVLWQVNKSINHVKVVFNNTATRWGRVPEVFSAGTSINLDGRPLIVSDD